MDKYSKNNLKSAIPYRKFAVLIKQSYTMKKKATKKATSKKAKQLKLYKSEKDKLVQVNLRVTKNHIKELNSIAHSLKMSQSEVMRQMIMAGLQHPFKGQKSIAVSKKIATKVARSQVKEAIQKTVRKAKQKKVKKESIAPKEEGIASIANAQG